MENKKDYFKNWRKEHKDSIKESNRKWHEKNREKHNKMMKERQENLKKPKVYIHYIDWQGHTLFYIGSTMFPVYDRWQRGYTNGKFSKFIIDNGGYDVVWRMMSHKILEEYKKDEITTDELRKREQMALDFFKAVFGEKYCLNTNNAH